MKKLIVSLLLATASVPVLAWGDREQGILAGIAGTILLQNIARGDANIQIAPQVVVPYQLYAPYYENRYDRHHNHHYRHHPRVEVYPYHTPYCTWVTDRQLDRYGNLYLTERRICR